jgi:hypothetical protein
MKIDVVEGPTGLLLIHVLRMERLACEAAYNRFLLSHNLAYWTLIVRASFCNQSFFAQSITSDGHASEEIVISHSSEISAKLTELLESELNRWMDRASASQASG